MKKDLRYYLRLKYPVLLTEGVDSGAPFVEALIPELPGCGAYGRNREEALQRLEEAKELWIKARLKRSLPIPEPVSEEEFSGKFLLRITPDLHRRLSLKARTEGTSLNQYIRRVFEKHLDMEQILERMKSIEQEMSGLRTAIYVQSRFLQTTSAVSPITRYGLLGQREDDIYIYGAEPAYLGPTVAQAQIGTQKANNILVLQPKEGT